MERIVTVKEKTPKSPHTPANRNSGDAGGVTNLLDRREDVSDSRSGNNETDLKLLSEQVERLKEHLDELPEVDATRVIQIHNRIQAGDYQVDAVRIAEKLTALETSLDQGSK